MNPFRFLYFSLLRKFESEEARLQRLEAKALEEMVFLAMSVKEEDLCEASLRTIETPVLWQLLVFQWWERIPNDLWESVSGSERGKLHTLVDKELQRRGIETPSARRGARRRG